MPTQTQTQPSPSGASLRDYVQHKPGCSSRWCQRPNCGGPFWVRHDKQTEYYTHEFEPKPCTCGLDALLAESSPAQTDSSATAGECWYCFKPGHVYRHSGVYNISMCDACRDAGKPDSEVALPHRETS